MKNGNSGYQKVIRPARKKKRGPIIAVVVIVVIVAAAVVFTALKFNSIMLYFGKSGVQIDKMDDVKSNVGKSGLFGPVSEQNDGNGKKITATSKDGAVVMTVTNAKDGGRTVQFQIDAKKAKDIDWNGIRHKDLGAISSAKKTSESYLGTVMDKSQMSGLEASAAPELYNKYKTNKGNLSYSKQYGGTTVSINGNAKDGIVTMTIK